MRMANASAGGDAALRERYLELVKSVVTYAFWPEPGLPLGIRTEHPLKRAVVRAATALASAFSCDIIKRPQITDEQRRVGAFWPALALTMVGRVRLNQLQHAVETVISEGVSGDLIETGVWRGGATILMRAVLAAHGVTDRTVYVADSFAGLPPPDPQRHPADAGDQHHKKHFLAVSQEEVAANFERFGLLDEQVVFLKGWFADSLPRAAISNIAVLRLDGDMYGSTLDAIDALYPKLSAGGFCIVDDYALAGCRAAIDDYRRDHGITAAIQPIDWTGIYWRKE